MGITFLEFLRETLIEDRVGLRPVKFVKTIKLAWQVRRERDQLAALTDERLAEMGIHPAHARTEAARGLFDLPKSRLDKL